MKKILSLLAVFLTVVSAAFADDNNSKLLPGEFSVSALKKVQFTNGNLYCDASDADKPAWSIAANQTDYETTWSTSKVDHFYYHKTASVAYSNLLYSEACNTQALRNDDELFCGQFGELAPLTIGADEQLYALMGTEWKYLFEKRPNAANLIKWGVTVTNDGTEYKNCIIIAPDNYNFTTTPLAESYTLAEVNDLGLVCLPAAGYRSYETITDNDSKGYYWTNTPIRADWNGAQYVSTDSKGITEGTKARHSGYTIRLVKTVAYTATTSDDGTTATVGTYTDLVTALGNSSVKTIIVSEAIQVPDGTTLDGQGKTIQVQTPYCTEEGTVASDYDWYNVFTINGNSGTSSNPVTVTLKNMTIYGGNFGDIFSAGGIRVLSGAFLNLEDVTVARSGRGIYLGYDIYPTGRPQSKAILKNCRIVRNVATFGAGIVNAAGTLLVDNCSFTENRSNGGTKYGGAGAIENKGGTMYANNTVIANNWTPECGGAINNNFGTLYLMNCTVAGNVTTNSAQFGGGIGYYGGTFYAVNTILMNNYYINGTAVTRSDIGFRQLNNVYLYNCLYGGFGGDTGVEPAEYSTCIQADDDDAVFATYNSDGILNGDGGTTTGFKHPVLAHTTDGSFNLFAPAETASLEETEVPTYFEYTNNLSSVKMSYGSENTKLGSLSAASTSKQVTTYYESGAYYNSGTRDTKQIGASGIYYTVKLSTDLINGAVEGATTSGNTYLKDTERTVDVTPSNGCEFMCWNEDNSAGDVLSSSTPYTFKVTKDITLYPSIKLIVADGTDFVLPSTLEGVETKIVDAAEYTRNLGDNTWGTLCLPFTFKVDDTKFKCYKLASVDLTNGIMNFTKIDEGTEVAAGTPVIVRQAKYTDDAKTTVQSSGNATGTKVAVVATGSSVAQDATTWTLHGTLKKMYLTKDDGIEYYFFNGDKFWYTNFSKFPHDVTIPAYRSYFTTSDAAVKCFAFTIEAIDGEEVTTIGTIDANGVASFNEDGPAYNLAGQQVDKSVKGIVIVNGKKIFRK